ncbi:hypothetical protein GH714_041824 [Hevea brasiliensis]|uniref:Uncharacterized protein n=1 Tax=Hevea brasiliensis TaxID=3981 RepID=A0A6A6MWB2_HEVBR|nr:hypothetical protein GH714_041824 [Hevea brasiliensis]
MKKKQSKMSHSFNSSRGSLNDRLGRRASVYRPRKSDVESSSSYSRPKRVKLKVITRGFENLCRDIPRIVEVYGRDKIAFAAAVRLYKSSAAEKCSNA